MTNLWWQHQWLHLEALDQVHIPLRLHQVPGQGHDPERKATVVGPGNRGQVGTKKVKGRYHDQFLFHFFFMLIVMGLYE